MFGNQKKKTYRFVNGGYGVFHKTRPNHRRPSRKGARENVAQHHRCGSPVTIHGSSIEPLLYWIVPDPLGVTMPDCGGISR
jgi:hypothetical protein